MPIPFEELRRDPDFTAPELLAHDAADRLLLETASAAIREAGLSRVTIIGDRHGALTLGAAALSPDGGVMRVHQDALLGERALANNARRLGTRHAWEHHDLDGALVRDATVILLQLPDSLDALREIADLIARHADPQAVLYAGGRVKHMSLTQNDVLGGFFNEVTAGLAKRKARILTARGIQRPNGPGPFPVWGTDPFIPFALAAYGGTFGGATLDHGTRLMLQHLREDMPPATRIVDLGCGNGVIATELARRHPGAEIIATDQSFAAVRAATLTVREAGVSDRVTVTRADGTEAVPDGWADLIVLNPPFHSGRTVHEGIAHRLIRDAARTLRDGGELWVVYNSHLRYRAVIERAVGSVRQVARDRRFTVVAATRDA